MSTLCRLALLALAGFHAQGCGAAAAVLIDGVVRAIDDELTKDDPQPTPGAVSVLVVPQTGGAAAFITPANGTADLLDPRSAALDTDGERLFVWDETQDAILAVNLANGAITTIADDNMGSGEVLGMVAAMAFDPDRGLLLVADERADGTQLSWVDPVSGDRTPAVTLSGVRASGLSIDGARALVADTVTNGIIAVDLSTGTRTGLSGAGSGGGPLFTAIDALADGGAGFLYALDAGAGVVYRVDSVSGNRSILSDAATGAGTGFVNPLGLGLGDNVLYVIEGLPAPDAIVTVDLTTGDRVALPNSNTGLTYPLLAAFDAARARIILLNRATPLN